MVAARAVLWASLVDDPSAHPELFPTEESQAEERSRLFNILERLVVWENSSDQRIIEEAITEIKKSCGNDLPTVVDPFCGGGTIPLEANRLGLSVVGGDLNPVPVLITKALTEIPNRFAGLPPVISQNTKFDMDNLNGTWRSAQGLAFDIRFFSQWIEEKAKQKIGYLYPTVEIPVEKGGGDATVIAWLWARTVKSPDPSWNGYVPLLRSGLLRKKRGKPLIWTEPVVDRLDQTITYKIREDGYPQGTMATRGDAVCVATGTAIPKGYTKKEFIENKIGHDMIAICIKTKEGRLYLSPNSSYMQTERPNKFPTVRLSTNSQYMGTTLYGMNTTDSLFTNRQLVAILAFSDLLSELHPIVEKYAIEAGLENDSVHFREGGSGATAYADAIITYLSFAVDKLASINNALSVWEPDAECPRSLFGRSALQMVWDFAEANPFSSSSGSWKVVVDGIIRAFGSKAWPLRSFCGATTIQQRDAEALLSDCDQVIVCTDPPYYDNVPYADLSDFFYAWLRYNLSQVWPDECSTLTTPKRDELVANSVRAGSKDKARKYFESRMEIVLRRIAQVQETDYPATIFYAFKQQELRKEGIASTGWETFLQGLINAGLCVTATWPVRTETQNRLRARNSAALASSVVLACRPRPKEAPMETRGGFVSALSAELPEAIRLLQRQNIAPVDLAQSAIGPGMRIFSRYSKVVEADGSTMQVRVALSLINEVLGEVLAEEESELDTDSRFALTWYEQFGYEPAPFGEANVLAQAKVTTVDGVEDAGIIESRGGQVRLLRREELEKDWSPAEDKRRTDWEAVQHLIRLLDRSETAAAGLLGQLGGVGDRARQLAYLLYSVCERKGWSEEAVAYNGLITAWPELTRLVATTGAGQRSIL